MRALAALLAACLALPASADALSCRNDQFDGQTYAICEIDMDSADLRLFLNDEANRPLGHFAPLNRALEAQGKTLGFAMNAGMYHSDRRPVGLYVENGQELAPLVPNPGPGNFGLLPNGVFCISQNHARVIETLAFAETRPVCQFATQSGPMLVIDGALHPRFLPNSTSRYIRNGVGTTSDGHRAVFAMSRQPVTFHEFGRLFRDHLGLPNALYLDGNISRLYAPMLGRDDPGFRMGPIVGLVVDQAG
ncbi:MAG: phosphodiester glycosidase family protein [Rhodobacteraceae bacterium]|nr:phosphodiester glycosidase family protein [Paracoccaceae bacterium]